MLPQRKGRRVQVSHGNLRFEFLFKLSNEENSNKFEINYFELFSDFEFEFLLKFRVCLDLKYSNLANLRFRISNSFEFGSI